VSRLLTPYDTGSRLEPKPWHVQPRNLLQDPAEAHRYGKVDFDDDEGATRLTVHVARNNDEAYTLYAYVQDEEAPTVQLTVEGKEALLIQPSAALQEKVRQTIAELDTETERIESEVYWQQGQALILVGGESGYRKQQAIMVYEPGTSGCRTMSAIVKSWADGVRDTRIG
jgi:transcriptional regulator of heat shock response